MSTEENQLDEYFRSNFTRGVIDHALRADVDEQGRVSFYIHPSGVDGETLDCWVLDNCVFDKRGLSPEDVARMLKDLARASGECGICGGSRTRPLPKFADSCECEVGGGGGFKTVAPEQAAAGGLADAEREARGNEKLSESAPSGGANDPSL